MLSIFGTAAWATKPTGSNHVLTHQELHFFQSELFFPRLQFATPAPRLLPSPVSFTSSKLMFSSHSPQQIPIFLIKSCL